MKVIVTFGSSEQWEQFALAQDRYVETLEKIGGNDPASSQVFVVQPVEDVSKLSDALGLSHITEIVVFYQQAEYFIAQNLQKKVELSYSIALWTKYAKKILGFYKQNRRKVRLLNLDQSILYYEASKDFLTDFRFTLSPASLRKFESSFELLLSSNLVRHEKQLSDLNVKLLASSLPAGDTVFTIQDCEVLLESNAEMLSKVESSQKQIDQFKEQIADLGSALDSEEREHARTRQANAELLNELSLQKDSAQARLKLVMQDLELAETQILSTQKELEVALDNVENEKRRASNLKAELGLNIEQLKDDVVQYKQDQDLLFSQLAQAQEELESLYIKNKNLETGKLTLKSELSALNQSLEKLKLESTQQLRRKEMELSKQALFIEKTLNEKEKLKHKLNQANHELDEIRASAFWKTAEPVRKLVKVVGNIDKKKAKLQRDIGLILTSEYFDAQWYLESYPDVAASGINPAEHYLKFGAKEGRFPSPQFDGNWYLKRYRDVADQQINPLVHFIKFGISEGRKASPKLLTISDDSKKD